MTLQADYFWKVGNLLRCIESSRDLARVNFCLLLMATNRSCISQLLSIREGLEKEIEIARSRFVEGLIRFQRGDIKKSIEVIGSFKREDLLEDDKDSRNSWNDFYSALYIDIACVFAEPKRQWVEGEKLLQAGKLHPINVIGDSHVLSAGWGYGENWFSCPFYIPGITVEQLASKFENRAKAGFLDAVSHLYKNDHFVVSVGEIDYRLTPNRILCLQQRSEPREITSEDELQTVLPLEEKRIIRAIDWLATCFVPEQKVSLLKIPVPHRIRLQNMGLQEKVIQYEEQFIAELNCFLKKACDQVGFGFIDSEQAVSGEDWFNDGIHKTNAFHKRWLSQYSNTYFS